MRSDFVGLRLLSLVALLLAALSLPEVLFSQASNQSGNAFDRHDLSGVWNTAGGQVTCNLTMNPYPPDPKCVVSANPPAGIPNFRYAGNNVLPDGVQMTAWAHDLWMSQDRGLGVGGNADPYSRCDPLGVPRVLLGYIHPFQIVQTPGQTWLIYETDRAARVIYTDGRPLPKVEDLPFGPTWLGYSVGHWEANDFIVETIGQTQKTWLDMRGHVHSEDMLLKETYRRAGRDALEVSFSFHDPKAYDKDWSYGPRKFVLKTGKEWELQESYCTLEEQQSFDKTITDPTAGGILEPRVKP